MTWMRAMLQQTAAQQSPVPPDGQFREFLDQVFTFLYTIAHWAGQLVVDLVETILGDAMPAGLFDGLIDPLGFLIILTILLAAAEVAKRIVWLVVVAGWLLIAIRVAMALLGDA
ncbi:MAG: hypothetical protein ABEK03_06440 [Candidatus Bipolaricaulia bacterium]